MALPTIVLFITKSKPIMMTTATPSVSSSWDGRRLPSTRITASPNGPGTTTGLGPQMANPMLWRMTPKPSVLITQAMPGRPAKGRTPIT